MPPGPGCQLWPHKLLAEQVRQPLLVGEGHLCPAASLPDHVCVCVWGGQTGFPVLSAGSGVSVSLSPRWQRDSPLCSSFRGLRRWAPRPHPSPHLSQTPAGPPRPRSAGAQALLPLRHSH